MRARRAERLPASADGARNRLLGKVHAMAKELALSEDSYRDTLERVTQHRSAALCSDQQLYDVVREFERLGAGRKAGRRPSADTPMARRCRALWLTLYSLDEIENGSELALAAFVKRQTGKEDMRFCNADDLSAVIEALKDMCGRAGVAVLAKTAPIDAKRNLVREQWARLYRAKWAKVEGDFGLGSFAHACGATPNARGVVQLESEHLDALASRLGRIVRGERLGRRHQVDQAEPA